MNRKFHHVRKHSGQAYLNSNPVNFFDVRAWVDGTYLPNRPVPVTYASQRSIRITITH